jgi:polar amino acid transport system substrate-binding protein
MVQISGIASNFASQSGGLPLSYALEGNNVYRIAMHRSLLLFSAAAVLAVATQLAGAQPAKPALYTADQATAGAAVYSSSCAACHGQQMEGVAAPALKGSAFGEMATAQSLTAQALLDVVVNTMPQSDPGSLKPEEYNAVTAYILQQNGYPAGTAALAPGAAGMKDAKVTP